MDGSEETGRGAVPPVADVDGTETFATAREELRTTFEYQVQRLREIDSKAIELLKANLLLIGIVATAGPILFQSDVPIDPFLNVFVLAGLLLLLISTGLAGVTYTSSNLRGGLDADAVESIIAARHEPGGGEEFEDRLLRSYGQWIEYNARVTAVNDMLVTVTVLLVIVAFVYIGLGFGVGIADPGAVVSGLTFIAVSAFLFWLTRLVYRMDHLDSSRPRFDEAYDGVMLSKGANRADGLVALREMFGTAPEDEGGGGGGGDPHPPNPDRD